MIVHTPHICEASPQNELFKERYDSNFNNTENRSLFEEGNNIPIVYNKTINNPGDRLAGQGS